MASQPLLFENEQGMVEDENGNVWGKLEVGEKFTAFAGPLGENIPAEYVHIVLTDGSRLRGWRHQEKPLNTYCICLLGV